MFLNFMIIKKWHGKSLITNQKQIGRYSIFPVIRKE